MSMTIGERLKPVVDRLTGKKPLLGILFAMTLLFQVHLVTKLTLFYPVIKVFFFIFLFLLILNLVRMPRRELLFILAAILAVVAVRIPYYLHSDGLVFTSDPALEALQPVEIRDSHQAPLYLLNSGGHNGTFKYLLVAFVWDIFGKDHLTFVLVQLLFFLGFLWLIYDLFRDVLDRRILAIFLFLGFMFIEVVFDYSFLLRGGPYLEAVFFAVLGMSVFLGDIRRPERIFLAAYFFLFGVYLHPISAFIIIPFILIILIRAMRERQILSTAGLIAAGALAGAFAMLFFKLFGPPLADTGGWFKIVLLKPAEVTLAAIPMLLERLALDFWKTFKGLFQAEMTYGLAFFRLPVWQHKAFSLISAVSIWFSAAVLAAGLILSAWSLRPGRPRAHWSRPYLVLLFFAVLGKMFLFLPRPFVEPRHNWDLAFCLILAYLIVFSELVKVKKALSFRTAGIVLLLTVFTVPHYVMLLKIASLKEHSYMEILDVLRKERVKFVNTDFIIAYPIYYLSNRRIGVTDSLGPVTIRFFYPWMREDLEKMNWKRMAYLFFGKYHYRDAWHIDWTNYLYIRTIQRLEKAGVPYRVVYLDYYTIVIPDPARGALRPYSPRH